MLKVLTPGVVLLHEEMHKVLTLGVALLLREVLALEVTYSLKEVLALEATHSLGLGRWGLCF